MMDAAGTHRCGKCGACLTVCPVYREIRDETASPRAKVQLIKHYAEKDLSGSTHLAALFNRCLMCGACTAGCPSGVSHDSLFMHMRDCMVAAHGEAWKQKVLFHFLSHDAQLRLAARFAGIGRNVVLERLARDVKIGRIPIKRLPRFNARPFRDQVPAITPPRRKPVGTVLYFTGCATNYVYEKIGHATLKVLTAMGFRVEIPKAQVCCALPLFFHGNMEKSKHNILTNLRVLDRPDITAVITDCATCGSALRREYAPVLTALHLDPAPARSLAEKVRDLSEFVMEHYDLLEPALHGRREKTRVTYHAPCHLRNTQGIATPIVEDLLARLPSVSYVRSEDLDSCCGGGGTFCYDHPEISHQMVQRKIQSARATGARFWATGCPGCRVNLAGNLSEEDRLAVQHPIEIIASALSLPSTDFFNVS